MSVSCAFEIGSVDRLCSDRFRDRLDRLDRVSLFCDLCEGKDLL